MKSLLRIFAFAVTIFGCLTVNAEPRIRQTAFIEFDLNHVTPFTSTSLGLKRYAACVPMSIANSILVSSSYSEPLQDLWLRSLQIAEKVKPTFLDSGMSFGPALAIIKELWPKKNEINRFSAISFGRLEGESFPEQLKRIHMRLRQSIANGFPPVINISGIGIMIEKGSYVWNRRDAIHHAFTVIGIQDSLPNQASGFQIELLNPYDGGRINVAVTSQLGRKTFYAEKVIGYNKDGWILQWSDRPNLLIEGASLNLGEESGDWWTRNLNLITDGLGLFE